MPERYLGQTLGKYRVDELVGSGGFAWVYRGYDPELEIPVALKVLKPQFAGDSTFEQRFRREASTAAKLRHPNIVKIFAVGREGEAVYFAMDYLPNGLADRLEVVNTLPEEFVARVGMDVASALGFAHREGVIHRDIKVDNILFDSHGNAIVADFGIARAVSGYTGQTGTNMVVGTPQYFAPEQARAKPLDGRADIYSLGVTLYRASTGRLPFDGDDWYEIARQHVEEPPPSPRSINPALSEEFDAILLACLAKHPDDRPPTGEVLCQQFAGLLHGSMSQSAIRTRLTSSEPTLVVPERGVALVAAGAGTAARTRAEGGVRAPTEIVVEPEPSWRGRVLRVGGTAAVLGALAAAALLLFRREPATAPPVVPVDSAGVAVAVPRPDSVPTPVTAADSARRDSVVRDSLVRAGVPAGSIPPPPPRFASVRVEAPGATISVDGREVGDDAWRADTVRPGTHVFAAYVPAPEGCETARVTITRQLAASATPRVVRLEPRGCGEVRFAVRAQPSQFAMTYSLEPMDDGKWSGKGEVPPTRAITVPAGRYRLQIARRMCSTYSDVVTVVSGQQSQVSSTLMCTDLRQ